MSGIPLPTAGCKCGTCEWLRANGIDESGIKVGQTLSFVPDKFTCALCGADWSMAHRCPNIAIVGEPLRYT